MQIESLICILDSNFQTLAGQRLEDVAIESSTVRLFCQQMPDGLAGEEEDNDSARKAFFH